MPRTNTRFDARVTQRLKALEGVPLAGFRRRAQAFLVDMAVVLVLFVALELPDALREARATGHNVVVRFEPFKSLTGVAVVLAYFGLATWLGNGRTLGKRLLGVRVVSLTHERITLWQAVERALGYGASALEAGFGFLQVFVHPNRRAVHDRIAETIVVAEPRGGAAVPPEPAVADAAPGSGPPA